MPPTMIAAAASNAYFNFELVPSDPNFVLALADAGFALTDANFELVLTDADFELALAEVASFPSCSRLVGSVCASTALRLESASSDAGSSDGRAPDARLSDKDSLGAGL